MHTGSETRARRIEHIHKTGRAEYGA